MTLRREAHRPLPIILSAIVGASLILLTGLIVYGLLRVRQSGNVRCYALHQPASLSEKVLLNGRPVDCLEKQCWAIANFTRIGFGLLCYFPWAPLTNDAASPNASQIRAGRWPYRTPSHLFDARTL